MCACVCVCVCVCVREKKSEILTFSGSCDLFGESGNHTAGSVVLVESMRQLWERREKCDSDSHCVCV